MTFQDPPSRPFSRRSHRQQGMALVLTLLLLVVVTTTVLAYLVRSQFDVRATHGYSTSVQADLLASGVFDEIAADVMGEITDAGHSIRPPGTAPGLQWFEPAASGKIHPTMVPDRTTSVGAADARYRNLIKQSRRSEPFFNGGPTGIASDVPTTVPSVEGRLVNGKRWSLPRLLGDDTGLRDLTDSEVPSWVYLAADGAAVQSVPSSTASPIVGRYAFNVYDVSGLLNINVAGSDEGSSKNYVEAKGSLAFADLTKIPGLENPEDVQKILNWRSPFVNWSVAGDWQPPNGNGQQSLLDYLRIGSFSGWMRNPGPADVGNQFLSRRDLIRFFQKNNLPEKALPYLSHFHVDVNAPTFSPDSQTLVANASSTVGNLRESSFSGRRISDVQDEINPARGANARSVEKADGTSVTVPVLRKRFPLSWLGYVKTDAGSRRPGGTADFIREHFGLTEDGPYTWKYQDFEGSTNHIKTLKEVAAANRDPNFFEILKAVIQVGSLGQHKQPVRNSATTSLEPFANVADEHIIRIGASIIDQADEDSYPTRIRFNDTDGDLSTIGELFGVEDLPYLYYLRLVAYRLAASGSLNPDYRSYVIQPAMWNPHNPYRNSSNSLVPTSFKVTARSTAGPISLGGPNTGWDTIPPKEFTNESIEFRWQPKPPSGTELHFYEPQGVLSADYPPEAKPITVSHAATMTTKPLYMSSSSGEGANYPGLAPFPSNTAVGFIIGDTDPSKVGPGANKKRLTDNCLIFSLPIEFQVKYVTPDGAEIPYDRMWFNPSHSRPLDPLLPSAPAGTDHTFGAVHVGREYPIAQMSKSGTVSTRIDAAYTKTDPRSQRFIWGTTRARFTNSQTAAQAWSSLREGNALGYYDGVVGHSYSTPFTDYDRSLWILGNRADGSSAHKDLRIDLGFLSLNQPLTGSVGMCYRDQDGVIRRAFKGPTSSAYYFSSDIDGNALYPPKPRNVGFPMQLQSVNPSLDAYMNRPVVLNRPFRSVGELAYAFRDVPWKNLDLSLPESGDSGLLDVFCVYESEEPPAGEPPLDSSKVNINTCSVPVLKAILSGAAKMLGSEGPSTVAGDPLTESQITNLAERIDKYRSTSGSPATSKTGVNGPLRSRAELVGRLFDGSNGKTAQFVGLQASEFMGGSADDTHLPERVSAVTRAMADVSTTRTWNLMADLVVQTGTARESLEKFRVQSESRWWMFISIDRFTGEILSRSFERVIE